MSNVEGARCSEHSKIPGRRASVRYSVFDIHLFIIFLIVISKNILYLLITINIIGKS